MTAIDQLLLYVALVYAPLCKYYARVFFLFHIVHVDYVVWNGVSDWLIEDSVCGITTAETGWTVAASSARLVFSRADASPWQRRDAQCVADAGGVFVISLRARRWLLLLLRALPVSTTDLPVSLPACRCHIKMFPS